MILFFGAHKYSHNDLSFHTFLFLKGRADGKGQVVAPQVFNGETLCGNYEDFDNALEDDTLKEFLHLI